MAPDRLKCSRAVRPLRHRFGNADEPWRCPGQSLATSHCGTVVRRKDPPPDEVQTAAYMAVACQLQVAAPQSHERAAVQAALLECRSKEQRLRADVARRRSELQAFIQAGGLELLIWMAPAPIYDVVLCLRTPWWSFIKPACISKTVFCNGAWPGVRALPDTRHWS